MSSELNGPSPDTDAGTQPMACPLSGEQLLQFGITPQQIDALSFKPALQVPDTQLITPSNDTVDEAAEYRRLCIQRVIEHLVHACQCTDANCRSEECKRMKRCISHAKNCKKKHQDTGNCSICRQLIALCCYHAKHCTESSCRVPYCYSFKKKLEEQKLQRRLEQEAILRSRIAAFSLKSSSDSISSSSPNN